MAYLPKDYSRHENKFIFGLTFKSLAILFSVGILAILILRASFINLILKIILVIPLLVFGIMLTFYKTEDGDDLISYIFNLLIYYSSPKYLVYKKQSPKERRDGNGKKDR